MQARPGGGWGSPTCPHVGAANVTPALCPAAQAGTGRSASVTASGALPGGEDVGGDGLERAAADVDHRVGEAGVRLPAALLEPPEGHDGVGAEQRPVVAGA